MTDHDWTEEFEEPEEEEEDYPFKIRPDRWGRMADEYVAVLDTMGSHFRDDLSDRVEASLMNVLLGPWERRLNQPAVLNMAIQNIAIGILAWGVLEGYLVLTDKALDEGIANVRPADKRLDDNEREAFDGITSELDNEDIFGRIAEAAKEAFEATTEEEED